MSLDSILKDLRHKRFLHTKLINSLGGTAPHSVLTHYRGMVQAYTYAIHKLEEEQRTMCEGYKKNREGEDE